MRFHVRPALAVAAIAVALLPPAVADDQPAPLKFAWPVPSKATVTEKAWKLGRSATTRYTITLERVDKGDDIRVHRDDFSFVDLGGKSPSDPSVAAQVEEALSVAKLTPDLLVGPDGVLKDVLGVEAAIEAQLARMEKAADERQKAMLPKLREQMTSPEQVAAMKRRNAEPWHAWAGEWIGLPVAQGSSIKVQRSVRDVDGSERPAAAVYKREPAPDGDGLVLISREALLEGEATKASLETWIKLLTRQSGKAPPEGFFTGMVLASRAAVTIDPATMRPKRALREESCVAHRKEHEDLIVGFERQEFEFEWQAPKKAEKPPDSDK